MIRGGGARRTSEACDADDVRSCSRLTILQYELVDQLRRAPTDSRMTFLYLLRAINTLEQFAFLLAYCHALLAALTATTTDAQLLPSPHRSLLERIAAFRDSLGRHIRTDNAVIVDMHRVLSQREPFSQPSSFAPPI